MSHRSEEGTDNRRASPPGFATGLEVRGGDSRESSVDEVLHADLHGGTARQRQDQHLIWTQPALWGAKDLVSEHRAP